MSFHVRRAEDGDIPLIARLEAAIFPDAWSSESLRPYAAECGKKGRAAWIAEPLGEAHEPIVPPVEGAGYLLCSWVLDEGTIDRVGVAPEYRRRGVGHMLIDRATAALEREGIREVWLEVVAANIGAIRLYERVGFRVIFRRKGYYPGPPPDDALVMKRVIR